MDRHTQESVVLAAKNAVALSGGPLTQRDFARMTGISKERIAKLFPEGGWLELQDRAKIPRHPRFQSRLTDEELLTEFHRVVGRLRAIPSGVQFASLSGMSRNRLAKRFGGWKGTIRRYGEWLQEHHPDSPYVFLVGGESKCPAPRLSRSVDAPADAPASTSHGDTVSGALLNLPELQHAPVDKQGVVYLFGTISSKLGLTVEAFRKSYPDCTAKRCVDPEQDLWNRVRIEFEHASGDFLEHGHDPGLCDMIVCWEHDWPECPIEVLELRSTVGQLAG